LRLQEGVLAEVLLYGQGHARHVREAIPRRGTPAAWPRRPAPPALSWRHARRADRTRPVGLWRRANIP